MNKERFGDANYERISARASAAFPGGVLGRHTHPDTMQHVPIAGEGAWITDHSGRRYLDYSCGGGSLILGYSHPEIIRAVNQQVTKATQFVSILNLPALELAERVKSAVPWLEQVRFALSASESIMFAFRMARAATGREKVLKFNGAYHGNCDYALWNLSQDMSENDRQKKPESAGIPKAIEELLLITEYNDVQALTSIVENNWREMAAIIVEPVQRYYAGEHAFLQKIRELCDLYDIVMIYDEVVTGFRHALGGAAETTGITPDLSIFGKALGGGLPVSAVGGREQLLSYGSPNRESPENGYCYVTSSQAGNPLGCAAAIATVEELSRRNVMRNFHDNVNALKEGLRDIVKQHNGSAQVVGVGPLWDVVFSDAEIRNARTAAAADVTKHREFHRKLVEQGVMVRVGNRSYFSTAHQEAEVNFTLNAAANALEQMAD